MTNYKKDFFVNKILEWYQKNRESYPWRTDKDPYHILLAEILLRKTDRKKVLKLYGSLINLYGSPQKMASVNISKLERLLRPLGLYSEKSHQLKKGAEIICAEFNGEVPRNLGDLLKIPGVGNYTANAVLCFAYEFNVPLIDANLIRILKRYFNLEPKKSREREDQRFWEFVKNLLPGGRGRDFYYGILDFTQKICRPRNPYCDKCPINGWCSYLSQKQS
ncbi:MAG: hypothetical protein QW292_10410 [Candidatus Parvarchaeota archaeon]